MSYLPDLKNSHSEVDSLRTCERRHFYNYGLRIRPKNPGKNLVRGGIGHECLAEYYLGLQEGLSHKDARARAYEKLRVLLSSLDDQYGTNEIRLDLAFTLDPYFEHIAGPESETITVLGVEQKFEVRINNSFTLPFVVDLILRTPNGIEAWDHKFVRDFFNPNVADLSPQLPLYYAGLRMLGYPPLRVRYNELRYRPTTENKNDPAQRFRRPAPRISETRILTTMEEHIRVGERIYEFRQLGLKEWEKKVVRTANYIACNNCDFSKICIGELNGESRDNYIGYDYEPRD